MADSIDEIVQTELRGGTNVRYGSAGSSDPTATNEIAAEDTISAADIRFAVAKLRAANAVARKGSLYWCAIHPEVSHDLRAETGTASWRQPHENVDTAGIYAGEIGTFEGVAFIESPRLPNSQAGAGSGTTQTRVYDTFVMGQQALAEAIAEEPHTVVGPVTDKLMRLRPLGWYAVAGWSLYRPDSLYRIQTASSVRPAA
jgi:N4-gp56 family major capsid protein